MSKKSKLPAFQFYPSDWLSDIKLQACGMAAQGIFINMMCLMHQSEKYGYLLINGFKPDDKTVIKLLKTHHKTFKGAINKLLLYGVLKQDDSGAYYCERMVKDQALRDVRQECGRRGGNPNLLNQTVNQKTTPSSSSSSSSSSSNIKPLSELKKSSDGISFENIKTEKIFKENSSEYQLSKKLYVEILKNNPGHKKPNPQTWSKHIDKMIRIDKRKKEDIEKIISWCQQDPFWASNILSTEKLRKNFDQLFLKMNQKPVSNNNQKSKAQVRYDNNKKAAEEFINGYK